MYNAASVHTCGISNLLATIDQEVRQASVGLGQKAILLKHALLLKQTTFLSRLGGLGQFVC